MRDVFSVVWLVVLIPAIICWALSAAFIVTLRAYAMLPAMMIGLDQDCAVLPLPGGEMVMSLIGGTRK